MKLAYLTNQYPSISHSFIRREIEALERLGVEIFRFTIRSSAHGAIAEEDRREAEKTRRIVGAGAPTLAASILASLVFRPVGSVAAMASAIGMGWRSESGLARHVFYAAEALALASWMRRAGLSHVHAHFGTNSASVAMLAARVNGGTFSMTVHGPEEFDKPALIALPQKIRAAAFVAAVSSFGMSQLRRLVDPEYWDRIRIVPCGVEKAFYAGVAKPPSDEARFVCVGRLCEQKGQLTLIEAAAEAKRRGARFRLVLVGDGDMRGDIEALIARHGLGDVVALAGWKTPAEVRAEIEAARAFILPSYAEGLPVSIMEAMVLGRPVISTFVAGIPELVIPPENGWLTPAGDAMSLADAILEAVAASPARLDEMGRAARARALARHGIDEIAVRLKAIFAEVLEKDN
jgi:glycosyltransferase involved in cell wall biosynthesis